MVSTMVTLAVLLTLGVMLAPRLLALCLLLCRRQVADGVVRRVGSNALVCDIRRHSLVVGLQSVMTATRHPIPRAGAE
jgi:hypothetical protein